MTGQWTVGECPSWAESGEILDTWPEHWWTDKAFCEKTLKEYPACIMMPRIGKTCRQNDPSGPASCHCAHCNLHNALKEYGIVDLIDEEPEDVRVSKVTCTRCGHQWEDLIATDSKGVPHIHHSSDACGCGARIHGKNTELQHDIAMTDEVPA
jgi:hypothetical protein